MALTIYPEDNFDSYVTLADADTYAPLYILDTTNWDALSDTQKEFYLRQATYLIKPKITDPDSLSYSETDYMKNLEIATTLLAEYSINNNVLTDDESGNLKRKNITGVIDKEWFNPSAPSNAFPAYIATLLSDYGFSGSGSLKIERS